MCGIAGFYNFKAPEEDRLATLKRMLSRIKHRGPDESGIYMNPRIGLGSVRLSIIDLSSGTMPLSNADGSLWIVFNGEIFNYIELRKALVAKGHTFTTHSDTEVIVHLYEEYGPTFLERLNGQFAIAIWDKNKQQLFLARDRVGIRPLFYAEVGDSFVFGSEIKALLEYDALDLKLDPTSLAQYFSLWTALSPSTPFEGVHELPPGHFMTVDARGKRIARFWELPIPEPDSFSYTRLEEATEALDEAFSEAVRLRLRADVPVAAYLSGGIDSSVTTAYIQKHASDNLQTFSIGFSEKAFDESDYQNLASRYFHTKHNGIQCSSDDIAQHFKEVVWHAEVPLLRTAPTPMHLLARNVRKNNIKVVITGEGSDELLGGYNIFKETKVRRFWAKDPKSKFRPLLLKRLYPYLPQMENANSNVLRMFFGYKLGETDSPIYSHLLRWNNTSRIKGYLSGAIKASLNGYDPVALVEDRMAPYNGLDFLTKAQKLEIDLFMSGYLLAAQGDRMGMANSVEGRYPFLDHNVIACAMQIHPDLKLHGLNEKYVLKRMMEGKLPKEILHRSKQAYRAPIKSVLLSDSRPDYLKEATTEGQLKETGLFDPKLVDQLVNNMLKREVGSEMDNMALTAIVSTQLLNEMFVTKVPPLKKHEMVSCDKLIIES